MCAYMTMTLEKTRAEFEGLEEVESCKSERPQGFSASWGKMNWSTIDANGNETSSQQYNYSWDAKDRLVGVSIIGPVPTTQANNIQMTYDGLGRRVSITELHGTTVLTANTFVWCNERICQERDVTGHTVVEQVFKMGEQINGTNYYWATDRLGSVREMTDSGGALHANYDYDPWGRQTKITGDVDGDFGFTGFYINKSTNLYLTHYRAYDTNQARWISRDPIQAPNLYEYVVDNPLIFKDPNGDTIWLCSSPAWGIPGLNHSYFYDDSNNTCCGRNGSSGGGSTGCNLPGPRNGGNCVPIPGTEDDSDKASQIMNCCKNVNGFNSGLYVPGINDCHNSTHNCIQAAGLQDPGTPGGRVGFPPKCDLCHSH
jgi:RHS repeat-associated protein